MRVCGRGHAQQVGVMWKGGLVGPRGVCGWEGDRAMRGMLLCGWEGEGLYCCVGGRGKGYEGYVAL